MKTLSGIKLKIMVRAFRIRIKNGEAFEDIAADYPALTTDDLEAIKEALNTNQQEQPSWRMMQSAIWNARTRRVGMSRNDENMDIRARPQQVLFLYYFKKERRKQ